jgi:hypothetical protein
MNEPKYIVDSKGNKTDVLLPIEDYIELLEDLEDLRIIAERRNEETIPFEEVKAMFIDNG